MTTWLDNLLRSYDRYHSQKEPQPMTTRDFLNCLLATATSLNKDEADPEDLAVVLRAISQTADRLAKKARQEAKTGAKKKPWEDEDEDEEDI